METAPCTKCKSEISVEAEKCPMCGYEVPQAGGVGNRILALAGVLLTLTGVGAIIGIPLIIYSTLKNTKSTNKTVTQSS